VNWVALTKKGAWGWPRVRERMIKKELKRVGKEKGGCTGGEKGLPSWPHGARGAGKGGVNKSSISEPGSK